MLLSSSPPHVVDTEIGIPPTFANDESLINVDETSPVWLKIQYRVHESSQLIYLSFEQDTPFEFVQLEQRPIEKQMRTTSHCKSGVNAGAAVRRDVYSNVSKVHQHNRQTIMYQATSLDSAPGLYLIYTTRLYQD